MAKKSTTKPSRRGATAARTGKRSASPSRGGTTRAAKARSARAVAPAKGPVTLEEARAIARARQVARAPMTTALRAKPPAATAASVGEERKKLEKERQEELARRVRDYKATMAVMKKRGARRPRAKTEPIEGAAAEAGFAPLQIFAEGDSWFDYPVPFFNGGIVPRLEGLLGVPILNLAKAGDEVRYMLGVEERKLLAKHFSDGCPAGGPWDALLFSGGGNDIVDNPMALWIKDFDSSAGPAQQINQPRFAAALALVRAGYEDLITLRDQLSPTTQLVFHSYDFAIPDGRGVCFYGPWLKPTFDLRGFPSQASAFKVVSVMLQQFAALLATLATHPSVTFINTQGTLVPQKSSWHNELHPSRKGFDKFAERFRAELKTLFPTRVI